MGKEWDSFSAVDFQKWNTKWAKEALRICKPGAFMLVFGGTRTFHRLACGLEDAGWVIRDDIMVLMSMDEKERNLFLSFSPEQQQAFLELYASQNLLLWVYGSGFPKSLDVGKGIKKIIENQLHKQGVEEIEWK